MATLIGNVKVKDYAAWKLLFDADKDRRASIGIKELALGEKQGESGNVYMIWEVADVAAVTKMLADPELQKRQQESGVISKPEITILN